MNLKLAFSLSIASLWHRRNVLALVTLTLTLSITLLLGIQYLRTEVKQSFTNTIAGTDLIVGARSGQLNLLLYTVFHIGNATNNIRWESFQDLKTDNRIDWLVPISLGDSYKGHRVVGTTDQFQKHYKYGRGEPIELARGAWFEEVFEVVLGAQVASKHQHNVGDAVVLSHGGGRTSFSNHEATPFTVSGILAPTGTPVDQAVYVSLGGLEAIHIGWESGVAIPGRTVTPEQAKERDLTPDAITAALVGIERRILTFQVQRDLNQYSGEPLSAILPGVALSELWRIMGQFENVLLAITVFVVLTSLIGLAAVLLSLQVQRRQEIAILRATGASPLLIALLYVIECLLLTLVACGLALGVGAAGITLVSPWLLDTYGLKIALRPLSGTEWLILAGVPLAAVCVSLLPAIKAWRSSRKQGLGHANSW
ncbi:FtsX-like permease family protein [Marinobacter sp. CHS3-4]|uniref:ABC transporter permease n=1 Tax=Marinobacter sp. CHS3-4 TaxID=3045174 RepID=UPI0024B59C8B|nr:FtsX-like permease family protein [Marinobacter sp. CHS3-4]MDI9244313.1 ABC transporter permease [Marinobacter sp. CHS3-4]